MENDYKELKKWAKDAANGKSDKIPYIDIMDLINNNVTLQRQNLELKRVNEEQREQEKRLEVALLRQYQKGLEDAALICDDAHYNWRWDDDETSDSGPRSCARAIRGLKD